MSADYRMATKSSRLAVTLDDVKDAAATIAGRVRRTQLVDSPWLSESTGAQVFLKPETRQLTGAFKERGAANRISRLSLQERERGVIALSAGNHAQAVAHVAQQLGIPATIVMPATTPFFKVRRTESFGAQVVLHGDTLADAAERTVELQKERGLTYVHPYDDAAVIAGQGTVGLEIVEDAPDLDAIIVPVGGGGLLAGVLVAVKSIVPKVQVIGVETEAYPSLVRMLTDHAVPEHARETIAEGIAVKTIGEIPQTIARELVDDVVTVSEGEIERAIHCYLETEKLVVEGAGAASLALLLSVPERFAGKKVALIISGGNIDTGLLASIIARVRLREHRVHTLRIETPDQPGALAKVAAIVGSIGANILDVEHHRQFSEISARNTYLTLSFETQHPQDADEVIRRLETAGYPTSRI